MPTSPRRYLVSHSAIGCPGSKEADAPRLCHFLVLHTAFSLAGVYLQATHHQLHFLISGLG